jgi:hypothetical protein
MKEVIIAILLLLIINTCLLVYNCNQNKKEGYFNTMDRTTTRVGPYEGITSCSSWGIRNVRDSSRPIGDDSFIFNGPNVSQKMMKDVLKDNGDPDPIGLPCSSDNGCRFGVGVDEGYVCFEGKCQYPSYPPKLWCYEDNDCSPKQKCVNGKCV